MKRPNKERSLAFRCPELSQEWDYEKNHPLIPEDISHGSGRSVWWLCKKCHCGWKALIYSRSNGKGCPYCCGQRVSQENSLAFLNPKLTKEWNFDKNGPQNPNNVTLHSGKSFWWTCSDCGCVWRAKINDRSNGYYTCPSCKSLATRNPELAKEWHCVKNRGLTPLKVTLHSRKSVWWKCKNNHVYNALINRRSKGGGCPYCNGKKVSMDNCLATKNLKLAREWHPKKNKKTTPFDITVSSSKKVWWLGKCGHEWNATVASRNNGSGCPFCHKIKLLDGTVCDSLVEAYYFLKLKSRNVRFRHCVKIGLGKSTCDFYIPSTKKYIEVTSFSERWRHWKSYCKNILRKKHHVIRVLKANFEFIQLNPTVKQIQYVRENVA